MHVDRLNQVLEFDKVLEDLAGRTCCPVTAEKMRQIRPLSDVGQVQKSFQRISELRGIMDRGGSFPMGPFDDIRDSVRTAAVGGSLLEPQAFRRIHKTLKLVQILHRYIEQNKENLPEIKEVSHGLTHNAKLADEIVRVIDLQSLDIRDQASPTLGRIRREMETARERVRKEMEKLLGRLADKGILQDRLVTVRSGRSVLPVKESHRHLVKGLLHDKSSSGSTAFIEPLETLELNNRIRRLEAEERNEVDKVLRLLTERVREFLPELEHDFYILVTLDSYCAMALASKAMKQHAPALSERGVLDIKSGRHPLLVLKKAFVTIVPLNISVGDGFNTLVITGPNAGGKTVALKTMGLLALMTACGLHIPADADSEVPLFHRFFVLVGDAQSIEMDLSTFSARLRDLKEIVDEGDKGDLVLIDEIGSGTDPQEGAALAMAILEVLTARGMTTVVTTHHGALKAFAHKTPGVANGSMAFDGDALTPTYVFRARIPGSSYALEIARRLGIPEPIVERSRTFMGIQANRLEALILELEQQKERNENATKALEEEKTVAERLREQWEDRTRRLQEELQSLRREAVREARGIVKNANAAVEQAIRTIREQEASKDAIRTAKEAIKEVQQSLKQQLADEEKQRVKKVRKQPADRFLPGVQVHWAGGKKTGTVLGEKDQGGRLLVAFGDFKIHVHEDELQVVQVDSSRKPADRLQVHVPIPFGLRSEIDIRGLRVEEALPVADKFLSDAVLAGMEEVKIIHGIGTGILRKNVKSFLLEHPLVVETVTEGDHPNPGVTVVRLGKSEW